MPPRKNRFRLIALAALLAVLSSALLLGACAPQTQLLSALFEGVPPPGKEAAPEAVVRHPRRPRFIPPAKPVPAPEVPEGPPAPNWGALFRKLPKVADGSVDWVRALNEKLIAPKTEIDPEAKNEQPIIDLNVERIPRGQPLFKVIFPHQAHTQWFACANCHPAIFQMQRGASPITMEKIFMGEYCGRCHGKVAFALTGCARCHVAMPK